MAFDLNYIFGNEGAKEHWTKRGVAFIIDLIIIAVIYFIVNNIILVVNSTAGEGDVRGIDPNTFFMVGGGFLTMTATVTLITLAIIAALFGLMENSYGGSPGKRFTGLKVLSVEEPMSVQKALVRNGSKFGGLLVGGLFGLLPMAVLVLVFCMFDLFMALGSVPDPRMKYTDNMACTTVGRTDIEEDLESLKYVPPAPPEPFEPSEPEPPAVSITTDLDEIDYRPVLSGEEMETVKHYMEFLGISELRAVNLYNAGYRKLDDLKDAEPGDLVLVDKINPTVARSIIKKMREVE